MKFKVGDEIIIKYSPAKSFIGTTGIITRIKDGDCRFRCISTVHNEDAHRIGNEWLFDDKDHIELTNNSKFNNQFEDLLNGT